MNITISVDTTKLDRLLADVPAALARAQRKALNEIGNSVKNRMVDSFKVPALRPAPWAPRKSGGKWPLLIKSGLMRQGIDYRVTGPDSVMIGTPHEYIKYHQTGTKHMPARPVFPIDGNGNLTPPMMQTILHKVEKAFNEEINRLID